MSTAEGGAAPAAPEPYRPEEVGQYGDQPRPEVATRMAPQLRLVQAGAGAALLALLCAVVAAVRFPAFSAQDTGVGWAVGAALAAAAMLAVAVIQLLVWRRALASWRGEHAEDLRTEVRLSWWAHVASYPVAVVALVLALTGGAEAGWTAVSASLLVLTLVLVLVAQLLAGVQYLRLDGPPGTLPAHLRRMAARARSREDTLDEI